MVGIVGALFGGDSDRAWRFKSLDTEAPFEINGDFRPRDGIRYKVSSNIATAQGLGDQGELLNFLGEKSDRVSITIEIYSEREALFGFFGDDIEPRIAELEQLAAKIPFLGRPPIVRFSWGQFARRVMCPDVDVEIRRLHPDGTYAEAAVSISMIAIKKVAVEITEPGTPPAESTEVVITPGDTFELLAARYLRDPMRGHQLRLRHSELVGGIETPGARVLVVDRTHPDVRGPIQFVSPPLQPGEDFDEEFAALLASRRAPVTLPD